MITAITTCDEWSRQVVSAAYEDILLDEICDKRIYAPREGETHDQVVENAYNDWENGDTDVLVIVPDEGKAKLNPADLKGLDMLVWEDLRMAFLKEGDDAAEVQKQLEEALRRDFEIDNPRITNTLSPEEWRTWDCVLVSDREKGIRDFMNVSNHLGVAFTTGRGLIATSPWTAESFCGAIYLAKDIDAARQRWDEAHENPLPKLFHDRREEYHRPSRFVPPSETPETSETI